MQRTSWYFDAHLHADGLSADDLRQMAWFGLKAALLPAHDAPGASARDLLAHFTDLATRQSDRLWALGIRPFVALGIHPARIPWHGVETVLEAIPSLAVGGRVRAIGEIGLETGSAREEQILERQLELARELNLPVLVHTPERDKARVTRRVLSILRESALPPGSVLVDHASAETLRPIREWGFHAGLTVHPSRSSDRDVVKLVKAHGTEGIVLSSDAGDGVNDILALARTAALLESEGLSRTVVRRVLVDNALAFLGIAREALEEAPAPVARRSAGRDRR
ncbi:MAG: TatD family hydrolase [Myxococcales bacterium]